MYICTDEYVYMEYIYIYTYAKLYNDMEQAVVMIIATTTTTIMMTNNKHYTNDI